MSSLADCHVHLDQFEDFEAIEEELAQTGITSALTAGMDLESSRKSIELASRSHRVQGAIGLHPWNVNEGWVELQGEFSALARDANCVAISEVGLDSNFVAVPEELQREALMWFIQLAQRESLPMVLHLQVPVVQFLDLWTSIEGDAPVAAIHGFFGTPAEAQSLLDHGLWLSLGTTSTGFFGGPSVEDRVIRMVPEDRLLIDSDACVPAGLARSVPALTPDSRKMLEGLAPMMPGAVLPVAESVARARGVTVEHLSKLISGNFERFLNLSMNSNSGTNSNLESLHGI